MSALRFGDGLFCSEVARCSFGVCPATDEWLGSVWISLRVRRQNLRIAARGGTSGRQRVSVNRCEFLFFLVFVERTRIQPTVARVELKTPVARDRLNRDSSVAVARPRSAALAAPRLGARARYINVAESAGHETQRGRIIRLNYRGSFIVTPLWLTVSENRSEQSRFFARETTVDGVSFACVCNCFSFTI